jgi:hypothetical protein
LPIDPEGGAVIEPSGCGAVKPGLSLAFCAIAAAVVTANTAAVKTIASFMLSFLVRDNTPLNNPKVTCSSGRWIRNSAKPMWGEDEHAIPWSKLTDLRHFSGGTAPIFTEGQLRGAPAFSRDGDWDSSGRIQEQELLHDYYRTPYYWGVRPSRERTRANITRLLLDGSASGTSVRYLTEELARQWLWERHDALDRWGRAGQQNQGRWRPGRTARRRRSAEAGSRRPAGSAITTGRA